MARKRKLAPKSNQSFEPPLKQQQQPLVEEEVVVEEEEEYEEVEEEVEVEEEEEEDEEEDPQEEEEEDDDEENDEDQEKQHEPDDDPIEKLLEPLTKDQILILLSEAATNHRDVADRIRRMADADAAHRKIFVHGLGWDSTAETLINAFRQYGEIEDCKAVSDKVTGKSKGYGFILFKTRRAAREALKQPQKKIGNRMTACQLASIGPAQGQQVAASVAGPLVVPQTVSAAPVGSEYTQRKIYVSNVGAELDPKRLRVFFSKYGEIEEGPLGLDKVTGKPKGFCLFVYKSAESAKGALLEPHKEFEGHILHCQRAIDGPKPGRLQQPPQGNNRGMQFQRNENAGFIGGVGVSGVGGSAAAAAPGHLMAPAGPGIGFNQGTAAAAQAFNPALGQALASLLASQGATLGLTNLLGSLGSTAVANPAVPAVGHGLQAGYTAQPSINPSVIGGYGNQIAYPTNQQQIGQGGSGRGQPGVGQYGGIAPYMGQQ
ncbi:putative RNA recognition motif domain-containing protein [Lupinus albus]|uniref:Putative RNA recognition motif domain-containing protein n=1 Tax=Lupinus albus TaxID=3870 RepID=A0A6A4PCC2_LUPAL|nr:putative RNA recognition motif domain-containing protein [Lupinus albus]